MNYALRGKNALAVFYPFSAGTVFYPFSRFLKAFSTSFLGTVFYPFSETVFCPFSGADVIVLGFFVRFLSVLRVPFFYPFCGDCFLPVFTFSPQESLRRENEQKTVRTFFCD